jgi:GR25 family glycosyltransferase involved in LPS biosynthesis
MNLDHRQDRLQAITEELKKVACFTDVSRIPGIFTPELGTLGCSRSHIQALEKIVSSEDDEDSLHIIFEDDFQFSPDYPTFVLNDYFHHIHSLMSCSDNMDVFCLGVNVLESEKVHNTVVISGPTTFQVIRLNRSQAHSGYIVKKRFAPILLKNYRESESVIMQSNAPIHPYCCDVYCQHLQQKWGWFSTEPRIGRQRPGYSDICKEDVNHHC